jgi:rhamnogalacturonan endolyase
MAISDIRQRRMASTKDRDDGQKLAYPEAVLLTHPSNPQFKGEVTK